MRSILVLQPIRPNHPPALRHRANELLRAMELNNDMRFDIQQDDSALATPPHPSLYMRHATVRNYMLDTYLRADHDYVLWVDSDLIDYPADLPARLMEVALCCPVCNEPHGYTYTHEYTNWCGSIVAPLALLSETSGFKQRFYDIGGFIEQGNRARMFPPYFDQAGELIDLDSVGCCYLAPAALYRDGVRYAPPPTDYYVEHWSVMKEARKRGYAVRCLTTCAAVHAWLPDYGLESN